MTPLNFNKMAVSSCNYLKFGICGLYTTKFWMKKKISKKPVFEPKPSNIWKKLRFLPKNAKNAIFETKMAKMTQMGWKLAKINFKVLSKKLTEQNFDFLLFFCFFSFFWPKLSENWPKMAFSGDFWPKIPKNLGDTEKNQNSDPKKSCKTNFV